MKVMVRPPAVPVKLWSPGVGPRMRLAPAIPFESVCEFGAVDGAAVARHGRREAHSQTRYGHAILVDDFKNDSAVGQRLTHGAFKVGRSFIEIDNRVGIAVAHQIQIGNANRAGASGDEDLTPRICRLEAGCRST